MSAATTALEVIADALRIGGPAIADGLRALFETHRPELLAGDPPERQDVAIEAEDEARIAAKFGGRG